MTESVERSHWRPSGVPIRRALIALTGLGLLGWLVVRVLTPHGGILAGLFWPLLVAEAFALARFGLLIVFGRELGPSSVGAVDGPRRADVAIAVIVTSEDPLDVRTAVLAAVSAVDRDRVLLVGPESSVGLLAHELGVASFASDGTWASGVALAVAGSPAPHLALTSASSAVVAESLGQISDDEHCAWVQTQTVAPEARSLLQHLQQLRIDPTLDRWRAVAWHGDGSIVRVAAFTGVDISAGPLAVTIALQRAGWHGRVGASALVIHQGERSLVAGQRQSSRGASLRLRVLRSAASPLWTTRLTFRQRLAHLSTLLEDLAGAVTFVVLAVVAISVAIGEVPVQLSWGLLSLGLPVYVAVALARMALSGGLLRPGSLANHDTDRIGESLSALGRSLLPLRAATAVNGTAPRDIRVGRAALLHRSAAVAMAIALEAALVARACSTVFDRGLPVRTKGTDLVLLAMGVAAVVPVLISLRIIVRNRQLRVSRRAAISVAVELDGRAARLVDVGSRGAGLESTAPIDVGTETVATIFVQDRLPLQVRMAVVRCRPVAEGFSIGLRVIEPAPSRAFDDFVALWVATATAASLSQPAAAQLKRDQGANWLPAHSGGSRFARIATAATMLVVGAANLPPYSTSSAATPLPPPGSFTLSKTAPSEVLYGTTAPYSLNACNTMSTPRYNLSLRDVLPKGTTYVAGSGSPAPTRVVAVPGGTTTLLWENISDLQVNSCFSVSYSVGHNSTGTDADWLHVGDIINNSANSYANTDPRYVPKFDTAGVATAAAGGTQATTTAAASSKIVPIVINKSEPSPEHELMRGVHQHSTVYTLTVTNNSILPTNGTTVDDWLPAGLEFLGCGTADNAAAGFVEYPGAPRLDVSTPDLSPTTCLNPTLVETVQIDPDNTGPLPLAVYTHVRWSTGDLAASATKTITYRAGIPNRENALFTAPVPASTGAQGANLTNNTGALTTEPSVEKSYTNMGTVTGSYSGIVTAGVNKLQTWDTDLETVSSEDLAIQKSACNATSPDPQTTGGTGCQNGVTYGGSTTWTLRIETSEYRSSSAVVITDLLGDGLEYIAGSAQLSDGTHTTATFEPTTSLPSGGAQQLVWSFPDLLTASPAATMAVDAVYTVTYASRTLTSYRSTGRPVLSFDTLDDSVTIAGTSAVVKGDDSTGVIAVGDVSGASITSNWRGITKHTISGAAALAAPNAATLGCSAGTAATATDVVARFIRNSVVCFELKVVFPTGIRVRDALLTDFIPPNTSYVGYATYPDHTSGDEQLATRITNTEPVVWAFGTNPGATPRYTSASGDVFHVVVAVKVSDDPAANNNYDLVDNLFKVTTLATDGSANPQRALDSYRVVEPELALYKGVVDVRRAGTSVPPFPKAAPTAVGTDTGTVRQGDTVKFAIVVPDVAPQFADTTDPTKARVDPTGHQVGDAAHVTVWDNLPVGLSCADLSPVLASNLNASLVLRTGALALAVAPSVALSSVTCAANRLSFIADTIPAGYQLRVDYTVVVPAVAAAGTTYLNTAGVRDYNDVGNGTKTYLPASNIDPTVTAVLANSPVASDNASVSLPAPTISKAVTTAITEPGNTSSQATIGEKATYTVTVKVFAGTTLYDAFANDELPAGLGYVEGSAKVTASPLTTALPGGAFGTTDGPAGFALADTANGWKLTFPNTTAGYPNSTSADQTFTITYEAVVKDVTANINGASLKNTASLTWYTAKGGTKLTPITATKTVGVVEPLPTITKAHDPAGPFSGGDVVTYTLTVGNTRSPLHDVQVVDCAPSGLGPLTPTPVTAPSTVTVGAVGSCTGGGTAITWSLAGLDSPTPTGIVASAPVTLTYTASIIPPAVPDQPFTNSAVVSGSSIAGTVAGERTTYTANTQDTIRTRPPTFTKAVTPTVLTNGQVASYTLQVKLPAGLAAYDATVVDVLPANIVFDQYGDFPATAYGPGCTAAAVPGHTIIRSGQTLGWFLGDITTGTSECAITLTYSAHIAGSAAAGTTLTNNATLRWNATDKASDVTTLTGTSDRSLTASALVTVVAPALTITKAVDDVDRLVDGGQLVTYTITIANTGTSPAFDIALGDTLPAGLLTPGSFGGTCDGAAGATFAAPAITWALYAGSGGLANGSSCTVTYQQRVDAAVNLTDGKALVNTATVATFAGDPDRTGPGAADYKTYPGPTATQQVTGYKPTLTIDKTTTGSADTGQAVIGQPFEWTVTVTNTSPANPAGVRTAYGVDVTDTLPLNWTFAAVTSITGPAPCSAAPAPTVTTNAGVQTLAWTNICDLAANTSIVIVYTATPTAAAAVAPGLVDNAGTPVKHLNTAVLTADDAGANPLPTLQDTATATIKSVDLKIVKTDASADNDGSPGSAGFTVGAPGKYFLVVSNAGPDATSGAITVSDALPTGLTLAGAPTGTGWTCTTATPFTCTSAGPLATGASLPLITVTVNVDINALNNADGDNDPSTGLISNSASVTGLDTDRNPANNSDAEPTPVIRRPNFTIVKTLDPTTPFVPGTPVLYDLAVSNIGPSPATGPVTVSDPLPDGLRFVSAVGDGWDCSASQLGTGFSGNATTDDNGSASCARTVSEFGIASLPVIVVTVDVDPALTADTVVNIARVTHADDHDPSNDSSEQSANPAPTAALTITKDDGGATFAVGQTDATYTMVVSNQGPSFEQGPIVVTDTLPAGLRLTTASGANWNCAVIAGTDFTTATGSLTCTWTGTGGDARVGPGVILDTISVTAEVGPNAIPNPAPTADNEVSNTATVVGATDAVSHTSTQDTPVRPTAALTIAKSHDAASEPWKVGGAGSFNILVGNSGPNGEYGPVTVTDPLPTGVTFTSATGTGWSCTLLNGPVDGPDGTVSCTFARPDGMAAGSVLLDPSASLPPIVVAVAVSASAAAAPLPATNTITNTATVIGTTDTLAHDATDSVPVVPVVDLAITKAHEGDTFQVGGQGTYDFTVSNHGPNVASQPVVVTDTMPAGLTFVSASGTGWSCTAAGQTVTCTLDSALPVDAVTTFSITVDVGAAAFHGSPAADGTALLTNTATVRGPDQDPVPANNTDADAVGVLPAVDLAIDKSHTGDFPVGGAGTFSLVVTNNGPNDHDSSTITVVDSIPDGLTYQSAIGDGWTCSASANVVTCSRPGPLAAGDSAPAISIGVGITPAAEQGVTNTATVSSPERDVVPANNQDSDTVTAIPQSNLRIEKSLITPLVLGNQATWRLLVGNIGPSTAHDVVITDDMPVGLSVVQTSATSGSCNVAGQRVTCTAATLADGATLTIDLVVKVDVIPLDGRYSNVATVASASADPEPSDNTATASGPATTSVQIASSPPAAPTAPTSPGVSLPATGAAIIGILGAATAFALAGLLLLGIRRRPAPRRPSP